MEEMWGIVAENSERLTYVGLGLGTGLLASYTGRYMDQRNGRDHDYSAEDHQKKLIEEDPVTDLDDFEENALMEMYYDNFDHVEQAYDDSKSSVVYTIAIDGVNSLLGENNIGFEEYPEVFTGTFIGVKLGRKIPTPIDVSNAYQEIRENFTE